MENRICMSKNKISIMVNAKPIINSIGVKKMKQGMSYSTKEKTIIMNVFKYFRSQHPDKNVTEIIRCTSKATGCSEKSIFSFKKEEYSPQGFKEPSKTKTRTKVNINSRFIKYNETVREGIKQVIYDLKCQNVSPSLSLILKSLNGKDSIPRFSLMTLRRLLSDMGFYYQKNGNKSVLVERECSKESFTRPNKTNNKKSFNDNNQFITKQTENSKRESACRDNIMLCDNSHSSFVQQHHHAHKTSIMGHYGNSHENNINLNTNSEPHVPVMFSSRMPPYHIHSSVQPSLSANKDLYLKQIGSMTYHSSHLGSHNTMLH